MKRITTFCIALLGVALAAEVLRFEPTLGTISQYKNRQQSTAQVLQNSIRTSDNSPVPAAFANLPNTLATSLNLETTQDINEKVVGILPDGTRQLETTVNSSSNGQITGFKFFSSLSPTGVVSVQKAEWDEATQKILQGATLDIPLEALTQNQPLYGRTFELGSSISITTPNVDSASVFQSIAKAIGGTVKVEGLETNTIYTFNGRNTVGEYLFAFKSNTTAGRIVLESSTLGLEQLLSDIRSEGELVFLPDGRSKLSRFKAQQSLKQTQTIALGTSTNLIVLLEAKTTTTGSTELVPTVKQ